MSLPDLQHVWRIHNFVTKNDDILSSFFFFLKIPEGEKDPALLALKGRAYLNKGQIDQAFQVKYILSIRLVM